MARRKILVADLLCGAGGSSTGCAQALNDLGLEMELVCVNHWGTAIETHKLNHPEARHYVQDIATVRPHLLVPEGYLDLLMASPTCTHHSVARGGKPTSDQQRSDPWHIITWLTELRVKRIIIENVWEFCNWGPVDRRTGKPVKSRQGEYFAAWIQALKACGLELAGFGGESMAIHWAKKLATGGGSKGIRLMVLSQRVQALHNALLGSCETLVAHRLTAPADQKPVVEWLKANVEKGLATEIAGSLASLPTGTAWVCSGEAQLFERVEFPRISTFDNSATPLGDEGDQAIATAQVDVDGLRDLIGAAVAEAEANDPKALKAEIARLKADAAKTEKPVDARIMEKAVEAADRQGYERGLAEGRRVGIITGVAACKGLLETLQIEELLPDETTGQVYPPPPPRLVHSQESPASTRVQRQPSPAPAPRQSRPIAARNAPAGEVPAGCAKPLAALAAVYPSGLTEAQWATAAGYKRSGGTWGTYKSRLRGAGLIEGREGRWFCTAEGAEAAGDVELPPEPGPDLVRWWAAKLPGTTKIAEALIEAWPRGLGREELAARVGMAAGGGSFGTYLSRLAGPGLIARGAEISLSEEAMGMRR